MQFDVFFSKNKLNFTHCNNSIGNITKFKILLLHI